LVTGPSLPTEFISSSYSDETLQRPTKPFCLFQENRPKRIARRMWLRINSGESIMGMIKTDISSDEVWQAAQRRRAADIAAALGRADRSAAPTDFRRRLAIPTVLASLVIGVALWAVAGQPVHPNKTLGAVQHARAQ
jgi:hypothetical protein